MICAYLSVGKIDRSRCPGKNPPHWRHACESHPDGRESHPAAQLRPRLNASVDSKDDQFAAIAL
jgi:hypothetical protein